MINDKPLIHFFETRGKNYIYDVNKNVIINITQDIFNVLNNILRESKNYEEFVNNSIKNHYIKHLIQNGFLSNNRIEEIIHPENEVLEYQLNNKLQRMILQVTQRCNLRCNYCVYSGDYKNRSHANRKMDFETARDSIDFLVDHSKDSKNLSIAFYGGEPLLEFDLIKRVIEYAKENITSKKLDFSLTSNGTLLNDNMISYFEKNDVILFISLDGPKEIHDINRRFVGKDKGTFDIIMNNIENIYNRYPEYYKKIAFSIVIDPQNDLDCTRKFFNENKFVKDLYKASSFIDESYKKLTGEYNRYFNVQWEYEYFKLFLNKLGMLDQKDISNLIGDRYLKQIDEQLEATSKLSLKWHHGGPCVPGAQRLFVNVSGDLFPCERVSEGSESMKIGSIHEGFCVKKAKELLNIGKLSEDNCKNCWAIRFCSICAKQCDDGNSLSSTTKQLNCRNTKRMLENRFKDYCVLKEFGCDLQSEDELMEDFF